MHSLNKKRDNMHIIHTKIEFILFIPLKLLLSSRLMLVSTGKGRDPSIKTRVRCQSMHKYVHKRKDFTMSQKCISKFHHRIITIYSVKEKRDFTRWLSWSVDTFIKQEEFL